MTTISLREPAYGAPAGPVLFAAGYRPFFLFAGVQTALTLPLWLAVYTGVVSLNLPFADALWHGHEMVFGFAGAAVGGFMLTAVPNWTGATPVSGRPLMVLFALWLAGRVGFTLAGILPPLLVAVLDLSYLPVLAAILAIPLVRAGKGRNMAFLALLAVFWAANGAVHAGLAWGWPDPMAAVYAGVFLLLLMIAVVGGRIIPAFTQNWLRMQGHPVEIKTPAWIEKGGSCGILAAAGVTTLLAPQSVAASVLLIVAGLIHAVRLIGWQGYRTITNPILAVLHLGYLWLAVGLLLWGASGLVDAVPVSAALHALTAGAIGTMILAVMSRAALGHSGRPLIASPMVTAAYGLVAIAAVLRVIAPLSGDAQMALTHGGGMLWALAWLLFVVAYAPIMLRPRADGRPG